ncbi:hypothetical protein BDQ12DRAFT_698553 [Crucibulum laeve]|uniref:Uncharacterized protein n=1 Tax=Crucibulum laeve TaxID=68775 RepID=A0A5C3M3R5_9AGAR|nr:hypothetical protein BDQ12DRAFT_698553 [Crucibulum laeve]
MLYIILNFFPRIIYAYTHGSPVLGADFQTCLTELKNGTYGDKGGADNNGQVVAVSNATAISYSVCKRVCGTRQEPFEWIAFSQKFSSWLLPWLALVPQLPFGANNKLENLESVILAVGSPTLAAYSLALTALNGRWIRRRFDCYHYPNSQKAAQLLINLQQAPLRVVTENGLFASLVVLPQNDAWWKEIVIQLDYTHSWSVSTITSLVWVIVAFCFTTTNSFTGKQADFIGSDNGQSVSSVWLWLLPIVIGWLQISPKCDYDRLHRAIRCANLKAFIATPTGKPESLGTPAVSLRSHEDDGLYRDKQCTAPIYNYARLFSSAKVAEEMANMFSAASTRWNKYIPVDRDAWRQSEDGIRPNKANRTGTRSQVEAYCAPVRQLRDNQWKLGVCSRAFMASIFALGLQWGTTGSAILVSFLTPTRGLGCRSGSYVIYGVLSTIVWLLLVFSNALDYHLKNTENGHTQFKWIVHAVPVFFRRCGKIIALVNSVWIVLTCLFQFSNFYDQCYCNSSVLSLGSTRAYNVITLLPADIVFLRLLYIGGLGLSVGVALIYAIFMSILIDPIKEDR